jgi:hypothetical protein
MLHWNRQLTLLVVLALVAVAIAALGGGIHWDALRSV